MLFACFMELACQAPWGFGACHWHRDSSFAGESNGVLLKENQVKLALARCVETTHVRAPTSGASRWFQRATRYRDVKKQCRISTQAALALSCLRYSPVQIGQSTKMRGTLVWAAHLWLQNCQGKNNIDHNSSSGTDVLLRNASVIEHL